MSEKTQIVRDYSGNQIGVIVDEGFKGKNIYDNTGYMVGHVIGDGSLKNPLMVWDGNDRRIYGDTMEGARELLMSQSGEEDED